MSRVEEIRERRDDFKKRDYDVECGWYVDDVSWLLSEHDRLNSLTEVYPPAARTIALWLDIYCDKSLPYAEMIADAARKAAQKIVGLSTELAPFRALNLTPAEIAEKLARLEAEPQPLSIEYLKTINSEPLKHWVWIEIFDPTQWHFDAFSGYYRTQSDYTKGEAFCCGYPGMGYSWDYSDYGVKWLAYNRRPKEDTPCND